MKKVLLCYNPVSGKGRFKNDLDYVLERLQDEGYAVQFFRMGSEASLKRYFVQLREEKLEFVIAAGGDGTLNLVINAMIENGMDIPLGIIPVGTSNDFASFLGIEGNLEKYMDIILAGKAERVDIGNVNGRYFINSFSLGGLTTVAHSTSFEDKNNFGRLAYFLNGLQQSSMLDSFHLRFQSGEEQIELNALLVLVLNSGTVGGFPNIAPKAQVDDNKLDVIIVSDGPFIVDKINNLLRLLTGDYGDDDKNILYFQTDRTYFESNSKLATDIDGEAGPRLPVIVSVERQISVFR